MSHQGRNNPRYSHGMWGTPEYDAYQHMIQRCYNPKCEAYHNYGARGIKVCDIWLNDPVIFFEDMGSKPLPELTLERIDNDEAIRALACYHCDSCDRLPQAARL